LGEHARFLDRQAELPPAAAGRGAGGRDYPALAGLVRRSRIEYEQLASGPQRLARLEIDRELAARRRRNPTAPPASRPERRDHSAAPASAERAARAAPPGPTERAAPARRPAGRERPSEESPVMKDARAVAEGRKRHLGIGRP